MKTRTAMIFAIAAVFLVLPSFALAEEASENVTAGDAAPIVSSGIGAKVRMLQLEKNIQRNVAAGQAVIGFLEANTTKDTSVLQSILDQLSALRVEVAAVDTSSANKTALVETFAGLKADAINLTKQFRDEAHSLVSKTDLAAARQAAAAKAAESNAKYNDMIRDAVREYNSEKISEALDRIGSARAWLVQGVANGSLSAGQAMKEVRGMLRTLTPNFREYVALNIIGNISKMSERAAGAVLAAQERALERMTERLQARIVSIRGRMGGLT
jgi:hypothetical protein